MWKISNTEKTLASPSSVWKLWEEVTNWPKQDSSITSASINGPFKVGSVITLKPKKSPPVKVRIKKLEKNHNFSTEGKLPLTKLEFIHEVKTDGKQTQFTQSVVMSGSLAWLFSRIMGKSVKKNLVARMQKMAKLLQK